MGSHSAKGSFHPPKVIGRSSRRKTGRNFNLLKELCVTNAMSMDISRRIVGHRHLKKECLNHLRGKGKVFATALSDSESSNSDMDGECDNEGNYSAFMAITFVDSKDELSNLVDELGNHSEGEEVEESEDEEVCQNEGENNLQETYDSLLEDCVK